jgi:hypothetical protein
MHLFTRLVYPLPIRTQPRAAGRPFAVSCLSTWTVAQRSVAHAFVALWSRSRLQCGVFRIVANTWSWCITFLCVASLINTTSRVRNVQTVRVPLAWIFVHSVVNSKGTERSRTCVKAEEQ